MNVPPTTLPAYSEKRASHVSKYIHSHTATSMGAVHVDTAPRADMAEASEQKQAAEMIQRNYRGYRERRQLQGMGLDASTRWAEVGVSRILPLKCAWSDA